MKTVEQAAALLGYERFSDPQVAALDVFTKRNAAGKPRVCIYYPTGAGKTGLQLTCVYLSGVTDVLVLAPPSTHGKWKADAERLQLNATVMSHAKFRQPSTKLARGTAIIVDEFHLLGGQTGKGWKKFSLAARGIKAPIIIGSATPNYNDAERVYCVAHVLDPKDHQGGFEAFIYRHCITKPNYFARLPDVLGFHRFKDAEAMLAALPGVAYVPDEAPDIIQDIILHRHLDEEFEQLNLDHRKKRVMASQMEKRHQRKLHLLTTEDELLQSDVWAKIAPILLQGSPVIVFSASTTILEALANTLQEERVIPPWTSVYGSLTTSVKLQRIEAFRTGKFQVLLGTATLVTGTDGLDKMCDTIIILDDTDDDSMRRQLVGRILPRGIDIRPDQYEGKTAYRIVFA